MAELGPSPQDLVTVIGLFAIAVLSIFAPQLVPSALLYILAT